MAKHTQDRENLLRDATAMSLRGQTITQGKEVFVGFRPAGQLSVYWDQDPVFQFDAGGRLRRVYSDSKRYAAFDSTLVCLERATHGTRDGGTTDSPSRVAIQRQPIEESDLQRMIENVKDHLRKLRALLDDPECRWEVVGGNESTFVEAIRASLAEIGDDVRIATGSNA